MEGECVGHGMWGDGSWTGSDDRESLEALHGWDSTPTSSAG